MASITGNRNYPPDESYAIQLLSYLPERPDYHDWVAAISAVASEFPPPTALSILRTRFHDEKPHETEEKIRNPVKNISFGTLVHLARTYGCPRDIRSNYQSTAVPIRKKKAKVKPVTSESSGIYIRFEDELLEERAAIYEFDAYMSAGEANSRIIAENPSARFERVYRVAVNEKIVDKNIDPATNLPFESFKTFTTGFTNKYLTLDELADSISRGFPFIACHLKEGEEGCYRSNSQFVCADFFALDIDGGMTMDEAMMIPEARKAFLLYTTCSHTGANQRFRILMPFPRLITVPGDYKKIVNHFIGIFRADKACSDPARGFFGNRKADIWKLDRGSKCLIRNNGEII